MLRKYEGREDELLMFLRKMREGDTKKVSAHFASSKENFTYIVYIKIVISSLIHFYSCVIFRKHVAVPGAKFHLKILPNTNIVSDDSYCSSDCYYCYATCG